MAEPEDDLVMLVNQARRGEPTAATKLVRRFLRPSYVVALGIVRRPSDAEDVAQDAIAVAFERLDTCREPARFGGWLLQIVRNRALNFLDKRRLRDVPDAEPTEPEDTTTAADPALAGTQRRLLAALDGLNETQREVVLLHDLEEWTHAEIAASLGISEVMSRQHLFTARKALRARLDGDAPLREGLR